MHLRRLQNALNYPVKCVAKQELHPSTWPLTLEQVVVLVCRTVIVSIMAGRPYLHVSLHAMLRWGNSRIRGHKLIQAQKLNSQQCVAFTTAC